MPFDRTHKQSNNRLACCRAALLRDADPGDFYSLREGGHALTYTAAGAALGAAGGRQNDENPDQRQDIVILSAYRAPCFTGFLGRARSVEQDAHLLRSGRGNLRVPRLGKLR